MSLRSGVIAIGAGEEERLGPYRIATTALAYALPAAFILLPLGLFLLQSFFYVDHGTEVHELTLFTTEQYLAAFVAAGFDEAHFDRDGLSSNGRGVLIGRVLV